MRNTLIIILFVIFCSACSEKQSTKGIVESSYCEESSLNKKFANFSEHWIYFTTGFKTDSISMFYDGNNTDTIVSTDYAIGLAYKIKVPLKTKAFSIKINATEYEITIEDKYCFLFIQKDKEILKLAYCNIPRFFY